MYICIYILWKCEMLPLLYIYIYIYIYIVYIYIYIYILNARKGNKNSEFPLN